VSVFVYESVKALPQTIWKAEEMRSAVMALEPKIAVFDCDGTLWGGDAGSGFMTWTMEQGLVSRETCDWIDSRYRKYKAGEVNELAICGEMVQMYAGLRETEMRQAATEFYETKIRRNIFPAMADLVAELREAGVELWAVSSTNDWVIEEGMKDFGIVAERVLAARVKIVDGVVTSELLEVPTDEGKREALLRVGVEAPDAVFGNSIHDLAMMKLARQAFPINPSPALRDFAAEAGWMIYQP
jgi:phosphoserine phosphatase